jgi:hypothetical protein
MTSLQYVLPSFEHLKQVCEPYIFLKDTDAKLKCWSKLGLLRYGRHSVILGSAGGHKEMSSILAD